MFSADFTKIYIEKYEIIVKNSNIKKEIFVYE